MVVLFRYSFSSGFKQKSNLFIQVIEKQVLHIFSMWMLVLWVLFVGDFLNHIVSPCSIMSQWHFTSSTDSFWELSGVVLLTFFSQLHCTALFPLLIFFLFLFRSFSQLMRVFLSFNSLLTFVCFSLEISYANPCWPVTWHVAKNSTSVLMLYVLMLT